MLFRSHNGSIGGGASYTSSGINGYALSLNGSSSYADLGASLVNSYQSYTVSAWVKLNSLAGTQTIVSQDGSNTSAFKVQLKNGQFHFIIAQSDVSSPSIWDTWTSWSPVVGTWYHVAAVYRDTIGSMLLYVNGVPQPMCLTSSTWNGTGDTFVGRSRTGSGGTEWFNGAIDQVHTYTRALDEQEIKNLYTYP